MGQERTFIFGMSEGILMTGSRSRVRRQLRRGDIVAILLMALILGAIAFATATLPNFNPFLPNQNSPMGAGWDCTWGTGAGSSVCIKRPASKPKPDAPGDLAAPGAR
jgi:hypothetical protein